MTAGVDDRPSDRRHEPDGPAPLVIVPVRYPLSEHSRATLAAAIRLADREAADLLVLHVDTYQSDGRVTRTNLKRAVEGEFGAVDRARYAVRRGFLVEETILAEVAEERADHVVIGRKQASRWRRAIRQLIDDPDVEAYLRDRLDCELVTVG